MAIDRSWALGSVVGGCLLGALSIAWLAAPVGLIVRNAQCCLFASEGDGRRGIFYAAVVGGLQLATLALAFVVARLHRAQRIAVSVIAFYAVVTALLISEGGPADSRLWLNLIALTVAGLAILGAILDPRRRSRLVL